MTPERLREIKSVLERAQDIHHSPRLVACMGWELLIEVERLQATIDDLRTPAGAAPERE